MGKSLSKLSLHLFVKSALLRKLITVLLLQQKRRERSSKKQP
jgi:hypothetical protein